MASLFCGDKPGGGPCGIGSPPERKSQEGKVFFSGEGATLSSLLLTLILK